MNPITEAEFRKRLSGPLSGCYLFFGEEDYLKSYCLKAARDRICPDEGLACFNDISVEFLDFSVDSLTDALAAPPMMCDCKIVTVKSFNFGEIKAAEVDGLIALMASYRDDPTNLLIISVIPDGLDIGTPKKPSALFKRLCEVCTPVHFEASSPAKLAAWVTRHFHHEEIGVSDAVARFLIDYCGKSMYVLSSEIRKLCAYVRAAGRNQVTEEDIRVVSAPEEDCDTFALTNALMAGNRAQALNVLSIMQFRQVKPEYAMFEIAKMYCEMYQTKLLMENGVTSAAAIGKALRVHEYRVGLYMRAVARQSVEALTRAVTLCGDADLAMKSYGKRNYEQIEKLVCLL